MKVEIVFTRDKEGLFGGKAFDVEIAVLPRLHEFINFDYIEDDENLNELYDALKEFSTDEFRVTEVYHRCWINKLSKIAALLFIEPH